MYGDSVARGLELRHQRLRRHRARRREQESLCISPASSARRTVRISWLVHRTRPRLPRSRRALPNPNFAIRGYAHQFWHLGARQTFRPHAARGHSRNCVVSRLETSTASTSRAAVQAQQAQQEMALAAWISRQICLMRGEAVCAVWAYLHLLLHAALVALPLNRSFYSCLTHSLLHKELGYSSL